MKIQHLQVFQKTYVKFFDSKHFPPEHLKNVFWKLQPQTNNELQYRKSWKKRSGY
jgi:hypothetical protein